MTAKPPFSAYREVDNLIFFSGKIELLPDMTLLEGSIAEKTNQVMKNIKSELDKVSLGFSEIVMSTVYLTDMKDYGEFNEAYSKWFDNKFPARVAIAVKELPLGAKVEIAVVASKK